MKRINKEYIKENLEMKLKVDEKQLYMYRIINEMRCDDPGVFAPEKITKRIEKKFKEKIQGNEYGLDCYYVQNKWSVDDIDYSIVFYGDNFSDNFKLKNWWFGEVRQRDLEYLNAWIENKEIEIKNKQDVLANLDIYANKFNSIVDELNDFYKMNEILQYNFTMRNGD